MEFRDWPSKRIVLLSVGWLLTVFLVLAFLVYRSVSAAALSGGAGAVSVSLLESATLLLGPPLLLWFFWLVLRRRPEAS